MSRGVTDRRLDRPCLRVGIVIDVFRLRGREAVDRRPVAEALMLPVVVVLVHPRIDRGLRVGDRREHLAVEELTLQRLVEALHLARRGRRPRRGEQVPDAAFPADAVEQHLAPVQPEASGKDLPVVGEDALGRAVPLHRLEQRVAHRPRGRALDDLRRDAEARMVVDAGHDRRPGSVLQPYAKCDVHLPELHRARALPTLVVARLPSSRLRVDELVADERAVDRRARGQRHHTGADEPTEDRPWSPAGMLAPQLDDAGFDRRGHLMRARVGARTAVGEAG